MLSFQIILFESWNHHLLERVMCSKTVGRFQNSIQEPCPLLRLKLYKLPHLSAGITWHLTCSYYYVFKLFSGFLLRHLDFLFYLFELSSLHSSLLFSIWNRKTWKCFERSLNQVEVSVPRCEACHCLFHNVLFVFYGWIRKPETKNIINSIFMFPKLEIFFHYRF